MAAPSRWGNSRHDFGHRRAAKPGSNSHSRLACTSIEPSASSRAAGHAGQRPFVERCRYAPAATCSLLLLIIPTRAAPITTSNRTVTTAFCFSGSLIQPVFSRDGAKCGAAQLTRIVDAFEPDSHIYAVVNPCAPSTHWSGPGSFTSRCLNISDWAPSKDGRLRWLSVYTEAENAPPGNNCTQTGWPPAASRFYFEMWGWQQCLDAVANQERAQGWRYAVLVRARPDACPGGALGASRAELERSMARAGGIASSGVITMRAKPKGSGRCSDSFGIMPREVADVYFTAIDQYYACTTREAWASTPVTGDFIVGEAVLGRHLRLHGIRCTVLTWLADKRNSSKPFVRSGKSGIYGSKKPIYN